MGSESIANQINPTDSSAFLRRESAVSPHPSQDGKIAAVEKTILDQFKAQLSALENLQARVHFMTSEVQSLIRK